MPDLLKNIAKIYLNSDRTEKDKINPFVGTAANGSYAIMMVGPFSLLNSHYVNFGFDNQIPIDPRYMTLVAIENSDETNNEDWGVWYYLVKDKILAGAADQDAEILRINFTEFKNTTTPSSFEFIGFQSSETELNINFPTPTDDQYVGVGDGVETTIGTTLCYLAVGGSWVSQSKTVKQFEEDEGILRETLVAPSSIIELTIDPSIDTVTASEDNTNLDVIFTNLSTLNGEVLTIKILLGVDGINFIKSNFNGEYVQQSTPDAKDTVVIFEDETGLTKRVTLADLLESGRDVFVGTFDTASGLTCPDPDDLLCTWPNGIADPNDRFGWVATVRSTSTTWAWSVVGNNWVDTEVAATEAKDVAYDPASDPSTTATNVQDGMVAHGTKIKTSEDKIVVVENKTQNLDENGDIAEDIAVLPNKDLTSSDLSTATGGALTGVIQALIAEWTRLNATNVQVGINTTDILGKLAKDFSTLLNKANPDDTDLLVLYDGATNKNISYLELITAIETNIVNDQGYFVDLAALKAAIPIGEAGWHATLGDVDTRAVWDVQGADWIEVASKLYYTQTEGTTLEVRVTTIEGQIATLTGQLLNKEDVANKLSTRTGNEGSTVFYLNIAGVEEYVEPIRIQNEEDRTYTAVIQQVGTTKFQTNLNNSTLYDGRIFYGMVGTIVVQAGIVQISIDGGLTFKNLAATQIVSGNPIYVNFDLTINNVFGTYIQVVFNTTEDKWIIYDTNENLARVVGLGWTLDTTLMGLKAIVDNNTLRIINLEENQGVPALQEVAINSPIVVTTNAIAHELVFDEASIVSNEPTILDVDGNFNHVIKANTEPGLDFKFYAQIKNQGTPGSLSDSTFYIANKSAPVTAGGFIVGKKYRINAIGTTDFTAIGASANTIGIVFTATGVGAGTGSALIIFRDVRITAEGQDVENDRAIPFSISNDDYVAPFTPGIYYTNDGVNFNILQCIFTCDTLFPSGNAPASSETTVLVTPITESRNGIETIQKGHNEESVVDRKDLIESGHVIVATYQSAGQYLANKTDIVLDTNKIVTVLFSGEGSDLTELVKLSLDNGVTYYDVEFRETDVDLTVENATTHVMDLYFTGTKFIATYVDSPIENQDLPYVGSIVRPEIPKAGVAVYVDAKVVEKPKLDEGLTLIQLLINGKLNVDGGGGIAEDWEDDTLTGLTVSVSELGQKLEATGVGSVGDKGISQIVRGISEGDTLYINFDYNFQNTASTVTRVRVWFYDAADGLISNVTIDNLETTGYVNETYSPTVPALTSYIKITPYMREQAASASVGIAYYKNIICINGGSLTVAEIEALLDGTYFEGIKSVGEAVELNQLQDNRDKFNNFTTKEFTVDEVTSQEKIPYEKYVSVNGDFINGNVPTSLEDDTLYTILTHILKNTQSGGFFALVNGSQLNMTTISLGVGDIGINKQKFTTGTIGVNEIARFFSSSAPDDEEVIIRSVVLKGDWTNLTDEEALRIIQEEEFGTFEISGINYKSVAKNKFDVKNILGTGSLDNDGVFLPSDAVDYSVVGSTLYMTVSTTFRGIVFDYIPVVPSTDYYMKYTKITAVVSNPYFSAGPHYYDANKNFISLGVSIDGEGGFTTPSNAVFVRFELLNATASVESIVEDIQLEIGTVATIYEAYGELQGKRETGSDGLGSVPSGVKDDSDVQRTKPYILQDVDVTALTVGTNVDYVTVPLLKFNGLKTQSSTISDGSFVIDGFPVENPSSIDTAGNEYKFQTTTVSLLLAFESGKYANLAAAQADLAGTKIRYELETEIVRSEANNNSTPYIGALMTGPGFTIERSANGVLGEFQATTAVNTKSQVRKNTDGLVAFNKDLNKVTEEVKIIKEGSGVYVTIDTTQTIRAQKIFEGSLTENTSKLTVRNTVSAGGRAILKAGFAGVSNDGLVLATADGDGANEVDRLFIKKSNGYVGIGTSSPGSLLHVQQTSGDGEIRAERVGGALISLIATTTLGSIGTNSNHNLAFKTNSTNRMTITVAGKVGIGETAPNADLEIKRSGAASIAVSTNTTTAEASLFLSEGADPTAGSGLKIFYDGATNKGHIATGNTGFTNRMTFLRDSAFVGIGQDTPTSELEIKHTTADNNPSILTLTDEATRTLTIASPTGSIFAKIRTNNTAQGITIETRDYPNVLNINGSTGNVGIGTTAPDGKLQVELSGVADYAYIKNTDATSSTNAVFRIDANSSISNAFRVERNGNVGIGVASPSVKLEVGGNVKIAGQLNMNNQTLYAVLDPSADNHVGDRAFNDGRYTKYKNIMSTKVDIDSATSKPSANVTLDESIDLWDAIRVYIGTANNASEQKMFEIELNTNGDSLIIDVGRMSLVDDVYFFRLERDSTTTLTAYNGVKLDITYGSPANIVSSATTVLDIQKIIGIKY